MKNIEWGNFRIADLFERIKTKKLPYKASELKTKPTDNYVLPCLTCSFKNQGLNYYAPKDGLTILKNVISLPSDRDVYRAYYQPNDFTILNSSYALTWKYSKNNLTSNQYLFAVQCINRVTDLPIYSYKNKLGGWNVVKTKYIKLPTKNGNIDYEFMENFIAELEAQRIAELEAQRIAELEAYLFATGLKDYNLSNEEQKVLEEFENGKIAFSVFTYNSIFNKIVQGRRLKKDDQISGNIPFVMAGITNTGVVNYICNPVASFPKNSITIDIFGNPFYRDYSFGAGDDTGVYWNDEKKYSKELMLFFTTSMEKSIFGIFDYGYKLRSSQSINFKMNLPTHNKQPDFTKMETLISAIKKLVIKEVVLYVDKKLEATK